MLNYIEPRLKRNNYKHEVYLCDYSINANSFGLIDHLQYAKRTPSTPKFCSDTEISERCQKCSAEKLYACVQIHKVTLTVRCSTYCAFRNLGVSNKCPSGSWCIIFWKEPHVDVWCMGTATKEGVKNSARASLYPRKTPKLSVFGSVCGDQLMEL